MTVLLVLSSVTNDGDIISDAQAFDDVEEAAEAADAVREAEKNMATLLGDEPFTILGRLYDGDPTVDDTLTFREEV